MSGPSSAQLSARILIDGSSAIAEMQRTGSVTEREAQRMRRQLDFVNAVIKERTALEAQAGKAAQQTQAMVRNVGQSAAQTANAMRMVPAQMTDIFTSLAGGQSPMLVMIQQGGQLRDMFGGFGPMFRGLASMITPVTVGIGLLAGTVGTLAAAMFEGAKADEAFAKSLIATGGYAGMTSLRFDQMADSAAKVTGATATAAREALQALITTGRVGQDAIGPALVALLNMQSVTGQTGDEVAKNFGRMGDDVAKWAAETNKSVHFLTEGQFRYIKSLQDKGKVEEAQIATYRALADHHKRNAEGLGYVDQALKAIKTSASDAWTALMKFGAPVNTGNRIQELQKEITTILNASGGKEPAAETYSAGRIQALRQQLYGLAQKATAEAAAADAVAKAAAANEQKIAAIQKPPKAGSSGPTGPDAYQRMLSDITKYREQSELMADTQQRVSEADRWAAEMRDRLRDATVKMSPAQEAATAAAIKAAAAERAQAQAAIALADAQRKADAAMAATAAEQSAGVDEFLQGSTDLIASVIQQAEAIGKTADELERLTALRRLDAMASKAMAGADAETIKRVNDDAAAKRAALEKAFAQRDGARAGLMGDAAGGVRNGLEAWAKDAGDRAKQVQSLVEGSMDRAADAVMNFVKTGKLGFADLAGFIAEEWLRIQIRTSMAEAVKGSGFSLAGMFSGALNWASGLIPHANGLSYVPYNNYPALLHEGERVQTKAEAMADRSGSGAGITQVFHIGHGVTPQQVQMAMAEARRGAVAQAKGEVLQSIRRQGAFAQ